MTTDTASPEMRLGARPVAGESSGCAGCGHPVALHSNGRTACKAFACSAGPSVACGTCGGIRVTEEPCETCEGAGTVRLPCQGFTTDESSRAA